MARNVSISVARKELFELFEEVTRRPGAKVVIAHRDSERQAVLVSREYIAELEARRSAAPERRFKLAGSMRLRVPPEEVLADVRREQAALWEAKLRSLAARPLPRRRRA